MNSTIKVILAAAAVIAVVVAGISLLPRNDAAVGGPSSSISVSKCIAGAEFQSASRPDGSRWYATSISACDLPEGLWKTRRGVANNQSARMGDTVWFFVGLVDGPFEIRCASDGADVPRSGQRSGTSQPSARSDHSTAATASEATQTGVARAMTPPTSGRHSTGHCPLCRVLLWQEGPSDSGVAEKTRPTGGSDVSGPRGGRPARQPSAPARTRTPLRKRQGRARGILARSLRSPRGPLRARLRPDQSQLRGDACSPRVTWPASPSRRAASPAGPSCRRPMRAGPCCAGSSGCACRPAATAGT